jgi:hypothetical protein
MINEASRVVFIFEDKKLIIFYKTNKVLKSGGLAAFSIFGRY